MRSALFSVFRPATLAALASAVSFLAACHHTPTLANCRNAGSYKSAQSEPPLKFPPGLQAPEVASALKIPELTTPEPPPRTAAQGCLDEPPPFVVPKSPPPQA